MGDESTLRAHVRVVFIPRWMVPVWIIVGHAVVLGAWFTLKALHANTMPIVVVILGAFFLPALIMVDRKTDVGLHGGTLSIGGRVRLLGPLEARQIDVAGTKQLRIEGANGHATLHGLSDEALPCWLDAVNRGVTRLVATRFGPEVLAIVWAIAIGSLIAIVSLQRSNAPATKMIPPAIATVLACGAQVWARRERVTVVVDAATIVVDRAGVREMHRLADIEGCSLLLDGDAAEGVRLQTRDGGAIEIALPSTMPIRNAPRQEPARGACDAIQRAIAK